MDAFQFEEYENFVKNCEGWVNEYGRVLIPEQKEILQSICESCQNAELKERIQKLRQQNIRVSVTILKSNVKHLIGEAIDTLKSGYLDLPYIARNLGMEKEISEFRRELKDALIILEGFYGENLFPFEPKRSS